MKTEQQQPNRQSKGQRVCPQCGAAFICGIAAASSEGSSASDSDAQGELHCWCFDLPPVMALRADTACLCPSCLRKAIQQALAGTPEEKKL